MGTRPETGPRAQLEASFSHCVPVCIGIWVKRRIKEHQVSFYTVQMRVPVDSAELYAHIVWMQVSRQRGVLPRHIRREIAEIYGESADAGGERTGEEDSAGWVSQLVHVLARHTKVRVLVIVPALEDLANTALPLARLLQTMTRTARVRFGVPEARRWRKPPRERHQHGMLPYVAQVSRLLAMIVGHENLGW
jgi:hypothetical protein